MVVVAMALQVARSRADERWRSLETHFGEDWLSADKIWGGAPFQIQALSGRVLGEGLLQALVSAWPSGEGGDMLREWRHAIWRGPGFWVVLRQERILFGTSIEAHMYGGRLEDIEPARATLAEFDIELVVEP